jgi:hypothetical protein
MKKLITLLLLFTITLFYSIPTQAFDIPLNYGETDNDEPFVQTKNLFDSEFEVGAIDTDGSNLVGPTSRARTKDFLNITEGKQYTISLSSNFLIRRFHFYNSSFNQISTGALETQSHTFTAPTNAYYYKMTVNKLDDTLNITNDDIQELNTTTQLELGSTATSYAPYGFLSLNDIFVDGQTLTNPNFDSGTTDWTAANSSISVLDGILTNTGDGGSAAVWTYQNSRLFVGNTYYTVFRARVTNTASTSIRLWRGINFQILKSSPIQNNFYTLSFKWLTNTASSTFYLIDHSYASASVANGKSMEIDYAYLYNLNNLGIDHLHEDFLNSLYNDWQTNNIYDQGFTDGELSSEAYANGFTAGYEVGYGDGYTDAVEEDNAYALGFAKGLLEGGDMETGSSLLILIVALIGFVMMIFGFTTKRGIFNLLSVAAFVVLGTLLVEFVGFIIITIGLVIINIYYAFFGDI